MADAFIKEMEAFDGDMEAKCAAAEKGARSTLKQNKTP